MDLNQLDNWQSIWRALVTLGLVFFPAYVIGSCLSTTAGSRWLKLIVGFNCVGIIGLPLGVLRQPNALLVLLAICIVSIGYWVVSGKARSDFADVKQSSFANKLRVQQRALTRLLKFPNLLMGLLVLMTLGPALTFPAGWDELTYHIELPRRWSSAGSITVQSDLPYSALPSLMEIVFTLVFPVEGLIAPRLFAWAIWICGAFLLVDWIKDYAGNTKSGLVLSACVIASPVALMVSANCYVEVLVWSNTIAILYLLLQPKRHEASQTTLLLVILIGGAIATKMTSVGLLLLPILLHGQVNGRSELNDDRSKPRPPTLTWLAVVAGTLLFVLPFYARTWWYCGNPFSPYYAEYFTSAPSIIETSKYHHDLAVGNFGMPGWIGMLAAPLAVSFANELYDGHFGFQWILLLGLSYYSLRSKESKSNSQTVRLALCTLCVGSIWIVSSQQARFALPLYLLVMPLAANGLTTFQERGQRWTRLALIVATIASLPWTNVGYYLDSWMCILEVRQPVEYIRDGIQEDGYIELTEFLKENIQSDDKVLSLFEHRLAYLPRQIEIGTPFFQSKYFTNANGATTESTLAELRSNNINFLIITHHLIGPDISSSYKDVQQNWYRLIDQCIAEGTLQIIWRSGEYAVVRVSSESERL
ncbi:MAG: hypothetical protein U0930_21325 [Pirellulales bacterium]